jgi:thiamine biosynthesis lipoprotein
LLTGVILLALISGCAAKKPYTSEFFAMDTFMTITAYGKNAESGVSDAERKIKDLADALTFYSKDVGEMLLVARAIYRAADGAFDVSLKPVIRAWGFGTPEHEYRVPPDDEIQELLANRSEDVFTFPEIDIESIDFGGIAKGYASDLAAERLRLKGVKSAMISLGGNVYAVGKRPDGAPWNVAVQDPDDPGGYIGTLKLTDTSAVTSGGYQRYFERDGKKYHHIIDPATGYPAESGLSSVTVVCESGAVADALSTALFVMGKARALDYWREYGDGQRFDAVLMEDGGTITVTDGLASAFSSEREFEVAVREGGW